MPSVFSTLAPSASPLLRGAAHAVLAPRSLAVARPLMATRTPFHSDPPCARGTRARAMASTVGYRTLRCRGLGCGAVFYICRSCYRGQAYCGDECRAPAQRRQRRTANAKHQRSPEGRLDHRDHQRAYRARCRLRGVTDTPSTGRPRSATIAPLGGHPAIRPVCIVCGRVWDAPHTPRPPSRATRRTTRRRDP